MTIVRSREGDTISNVLIRALSRDDDVAEEALHAANPHLAQHGPVLPAGVIINIPMLPAPQPKQAVNVWD